MSQSLPRGLDQPPSPGLDRPAVLVRVERRDGHVHAVLALPLHRPAVGVAAAAPVGVRVARPAAPGPASAAVVVVAAAACPIREEAVRRAGEQYMVHEHTKYEVTGAQKMSSNTTAREAMCMFAGYYM